MSSPTTLVQRSRVLPQAPAASAAHRPAALRAPLRAPLRRIARQHLSPAQPCPGPGCRLRGAPRQRPACRAQADDSVEPEALLTQEVGEDAGVFSLESQSATSWAVFTAVLGTVLAILYAVRPAVMIHPIHTQTVTGRWVAELARRSCTGMFIALNWGAVIVACACHSACHPV